MKADYYIRDAKNKMLSEIAFLEKKYAALNDAKFILSQDPVKVRNIISAYRDELEKSLKRFFVSDKMVGVSIQARKSFIRLIGKYLETMPTEDELIKVTDNVMDQVNQKVSTLVTGIETNLIARALSFRQTISEELAQLAAKAEAGITEIGGRLQNISARTLGYDIKKLSLDQENIIIKKWSEMTARYGAYDSVKYQNGAHYPLRTYLDGRATTTAAEVHRATTAYSAISSGIVVGLISRTSKTCDTCAKWEGKFLFFTQEAKNSFVSSYPPAIKWPTLQELEGNSDHIFKFNCLHIVSAYPLQFLDNKDMKAVIKAAA